MKLFLIAILISVVSSLRCHSGTASYVQSGASSTHSTNHGVTETDAGICYCQLIAGDAGAWSASALCGTTSAVKCTEMRTSIDQRLSRGILRNVTCCEKDLCNFPFRLPVLQQAAATSPANRIVLNSALVGTVAAAFFLF